MHTTCVRLLASIAAGTALLAASVAAQVSNSGTVTQTLPTGSVAATSPVPGVTLQPAIAVNPSVLRVLDPAWADTPLPSRARTETFPARLVNASVRAQVTSAVCPLIIGAGVSGNGTLPMLVRAIGPGLKTFGVSNALPSAPELSVYMGNALAVQTNRVAAAAILAAATVGAFPAQAIAGEFALGDAALVGTPTAGALSAVCTGALGASGQVLVEFYDANPFARIGARFVNLSARATIEPSAGTIVVGFVIAGQGQTRLLLRGVGDGLKSFGVASTLSDPRIELYSGSTLLASNDNWQVGTTPAVELEAAAKAVGAFALTSAADSALLVELPAGAYTLHLRGNGSLGTTSPSATTPVALAEIYELGSTADASAFDPARSTNAAGLDLFRLLCASHPGNLIVSPYSIETALALTYVGSAGDTRTEMARALRLPDDNARVAAGFGSLRDALNKAAQDSIAVAAERSKNGAHFDAIEWSAANRAFSQQGLALREAYTDFLRNGFSAPVQAVDFLRYSEIARDIINRWVTEQTRNRILDLIPEGGVSSDTRLTLVNALYLKAPWDTPFAKSATAPRPFQSADGRTTNVPTMQSTMRGGYANENGVAVASLGYLGGALQFLVILPPAGQTPESVAAAITTDHLARWAAIGMSSELVVSFPKLRVEGQSVALRSALAAMGIKSAFDLPPGSANFDGIIPVAQERLSISDVFHKTFLAVDEEGTEAAAATAIVATTTTAPSNPIEVRIDRPFLFAIQHRATGTCLFLGRIASL